MCSVYCPSGISSIVLFVAAISSQVALETWGVAWCLTRRTPSVYARNLNNYFCSIPQHALSFPYGCLLTLGHSELRDVTAFISLVKIPKHFHWTIHFSPVQFQQQVSHWTWWHTEHLLSPEIPKLDVAGDGLGSKGIHVRGHLFELRVFNY